MLKEIEKKVSLSLCSSPERFDLKCFPSMHAFNAVTRPECCGLLETMKGVWKLCCRTQRADEAAAAVALVCVERPRHNNWFMDSRVEPLWGHYPSTNQLIWEQCQPQCHHRKKVRIHLHYINHHDIYFYFIFYLKCVLPHVFHYELLCVFWRCSAWGHPGLTTVFSSCSCTLSFSAHLLTSPTAEDSLTAGLFFKLPLNLLLSAVSLGLYI